VQAAQHRLDGLARRGLASADEPREVGRVVLPEVHVIFLQFFFDPSTLASAEGLG